MAARLTWNNFVRKYWEKKPGAFKASNFPKGTPWAKISEKEIFEAVVKLSDRVRKGTHIEEDIRITIGGEAFTVTSKTAHLLPSAEDGSFAGFHHRWMQSCSKDMMEYGIVLNNFHAYDNGLWESICKSGQRFLRNVGIPKFRLETTLFMGNYQRTWAGVHVDSCGVFHMPLIGTKKIRTWTSEYQSKNGDLALAREYSRHLKHSVLLSGKPGDVIYWPSDRWHIGESKGDFSVTWGIGYWFGNSVQNFIEKQLLIRMRKKQQPDAKKTIPFDQGSRQMSSSSVIRQEINQWSELLKDIEFTAEADEVWLKHVSAFGFSRVPIPSKSGQISIKDSVQLDPDFPIHWRFSKNGECLVACRGQSTKLPRGQWAASLFRTLNSGKQFSVSHLVNRFSGRQVSRTRVISTLKIIGEIGAIYKVRAEAL